MKIVTVEIPRQTALDVAKALRAVLDDEKLARAVCGPLGSRGEIGERRAALSMLVEELHRRADQPEKTTTITYRRSPGVSKAAAKLDWFGEGDEE